MLRATFSVLAALCAAVPLFAETSALGPSAHSSVTVILDFKQTRSKTVIEEMKRSTAEMMDGAGIRLDWKLRSEARSEAFDELVVVTFHGACSIDSLTSPTADPGPLASAHISDGKILPFADVFCDRIAALSRAAMTKVELYRAQQDMGRAMGKVLSHELMHMLTKSTTHGTAGVAKPSLS